MTDESSDSSAKNRSHVDRNWQELLQELRVAQTGVQILAGFLITIPFSNRFTSLEHGSRVVYGVVLCAAVAATFLLMTPVALHRALFHQGERPWLIEAANHAARGGLAALALAQLGALWLILDFVANGWVAASVTGVATVALLGWWVVLPRTERR